MSEQTNIAWTDSTHNFWWGCTKVSPGCANCYAETLVTTRLGGEWGKGKPRVRSKGFEKPLAWNKKPWVCECGVFKAEKEVQWEENREVKLINEVPRLAYCPFCNHKAIHHRRRVFSLSFGDWLDDEVPIEWLADMLSVIHRTPHLIWQLLTKRPENFWKRICPAGDWMLAHGMQSTYDGMINPWLTYGDKGPAPYNVWLGASVENQEMADKRIPELLKIPAKIRFLSVEPMLGPVNLAVHENILAADKRFKECKGFPIAVDWVIFGGESGPKARPCNVDWIRDGVRQCKSAGVATFVKQMGSLAVDIIGGKHNQWQIKDKKGADPSEWPEDLRVREFPKLENK
jgi:protein gp37